MIAYLDTSALIKVYIAESGQELVIERLRASNQIATARITYVEMFAVFTRLERERRISAAEYRMLGEQFDENWSSYWVVDLTRSVVQRAAAWRTVTPCAGTTPFSYLPRSKSAGMTPMWSSCVSTGSSPPARTAKDFRYRAIQYDDGPKPIRDVLTLPPLDPKLPPGAGNTQWIIDKIFRREDHALLSPKLSPSSHDD